MNLLVFFLAALTGLLLWMRYVEPYRYQISLRRVRLSKRLSAPLKILHLSDIHFAGPNRRLERFFDRLSHEPADLILVTGDIIDCNGGIDVCIENFKKLKSKYGIFVVFGNHDYYDYQLGDMAVHDFPGQSFPKQLQDSERFYQSLVAAGMRVLRNETVGLEIEGIPFLIHGLDDPTTGRANIRQAMQNFAPDKINLLLTHTVDVLMDIGAAEMDLSFSGHSHGGQVCLPGWGAILTHTMLGREYSDGLKMYKGTWCSISRGMGSSRFLNVRLCCRPEAIFLEVEGKT